jgi:5-enolpyruvylshikimate-3-phosphate synthase
MRTKLFLAAILVSMLSLTTVNAGTSTKTTESARVATAQSEVSATLQQMFKNTPLEDLIEAQETIQVRFSVNENNEMTILKVVGKNKELANYVYQVLTRNKITLVNAEPNSYNINLVFDIK